jgi:hypothetical protein
VVPMIKFLPISKQPPIALEDRVVEDGTATSLQLVAPCHDSKIITVCTIDIHDKDLDNDGAITTKLCSTIATDDPDYSSHPYQVSVWKESHLNIAELFEN